MSTVISPVFERMFSAAQIEEATIASLKKWFPTYLREFENQIGAIPETFPYPTNYTDRNSYDADAGEDLPKIVVIATGTVGAPLRRGSGKYSATYRVGIGIAAGAKDEMTANMLVKGYAAAAKGIMLQNSGLGVLGATEIVWTDEAYEDVPVPDPVQLVKAASLFFNIDIDNVITRKRGPTQPDSPPYDYGKVQKVFVDLEKEPIT